MSITKWGLPVVLGVLALVSLGGCAGKVFGPSPTVVQVRIAASPQLNPDPRGRPSPLVVRFYELKSQGVLENSDFFSLYDKEMSVLGPDMLAREEMEIKPGEVRTFVRELHPDTRYLGVIGAYRDLDHARWRATLRVPLHQTTPVQVTLDPLAVSITAPGGR